MSPSNWITHSVWNSILVFCPLDIHIGYFAYWHDQTSDKKNIMGMGWIVVPSLESKIYRGRKSIMKARGELQSEAQSNGGQAQFFPSHRPSPCNCVSHVSGFDVGLPQSGTSRNSLPDSPRRCVSMVTQNEVSLTMKTKHHTYHVLGPGFPPSSIRQQRKWKPMRSCAWPWGRQIHKIQCGLEQLVMIILEDWVIV